MTETTAHNGGGMLNSLLLKGILMIILGILMLAFTFSAIIAIDYLFGILLIVLGIQLLASGTTFFGEYKRTWWVILLGILAILGGILAFIFPALMTLYIIYLIAINAMISGFTDLGIAITNNTNGVNRVLVAITGILGVILGVMFIVMPGVGAVVLVQVSGIFLLVFGILAIVQGVMTKKDVQTT